MGWGAMVNEGMRWSKDPAAVGQEPRRLHLPAEGGPSRDPASLREPATSWDLLQPGHWQHREGLYRSASQGNCPLKSKYCRNDNEEKSCFKPRQKKRGILSNDSSPGHKSIAYTLPLSQTPNLTAEEAVFQGAAG